MTPATLLLISLASLPPQAPPVRQCCPPQAPAVKAPKTYKSVMAAPRRVRFDSVEPFGRPNEWTLWVTHYWNPPHEWDRATYYADGRTRWLVGEKEGSLDEFLEATKSRYVTWLRVTDRPNSYGGVDAVQMLNPPQPVTLPPIRRASPAPVFLPPPPAFARPPSLFMPAPFGVGGCPGACR